MENPQVYRTPSNTTGSVPVKRFPVKSINIYEVTEEDLSVISRLSFQRAFHTFLAGIGFSAMLSLGIVLLTICIDNPKIHSTIVSVTILSGLVFFYSLCMFLRNEKEASNSKQRMFQLHNG